MATQTVTVQPGKLAEQVFGAKGSSAIGFRFAVLYFGLYCFFTQILTGLVALPNLTWMPSDLSRVPPFRWMVLWSARHILRAGTPLNFVDTGSGDTLFDWVALVCLLTIAAMGTALWIVLDRQFERRDSVAKWFRVSLRICLAGQMLTYGSMKAIPVQMPFPNLGRLLEPYGNFSPMGVLWASIGASPSYEIFAGCAELLGGILLIFPRTTMLGALICLADMTQVFVLNMTYDVPVKLLSFHLILLSGVLLAPDFSRLIKFFFSNQVTEGPRAWNLFSTKRANRIAFVVQVAIGAFLFAGNFYQGISEWGQFGGARTKSTLYGIWDIDQLVLDGKAREPLLTDKDRWKRMIFDYPESVAFQRMDDALAHYGAAIDSKTQTVTLTKDDDKNWRATFIYKRGPEDHLELDGSLDGHPARMVLRLKDRNQFLLVSRGFHWVSEVPFNR